MSRAAALLLTLTLAIPAASQSFDCHVAATPREHAICSSSQLSALDSQLAAAYKSLHAQLSPVGRVALASDQRKWLRWLDLVCPAHLENTNSPQADQPGPPASSVAGVEPRCLENQYFTRVHDLQHTTRLGSGLIFVRSRFLYKLGMPSDSQSAAPNDPGFGFGSLRWPQIDQANDQQGAFNAAVEARAAKLAVGLTQDKNATFATAVDASGTIEAYYTIEAANDRLIDVTLIDGTYGWGAAHPLTSQASFLWLLDRNRELTAADVFLPGSGWEAKLTSLAISNLRSQPVLKDSLADTIDQPVHDAATDPTSWTLTRDALTITFGQYAIGPYALGMPQAHIAWTNLRSLLQPNFDPSTLPASIPKANP